jgi:hypothetical protein
MEPLDQNPHVAPTDWTATTTHEREFDFLIGGEESTISALSCSTTADESTATHVQLPRKRQDPQ